MTDTRAFCHARLPYFLYSLFASCVTRNAWATLLRFQSLAHQRQPLYLHLRSSHPTDTHASAYAHNHVIYT